MMYTISIRAWRGDSILMDERFCVVSTDMEPIPLLRHFTTMYCNDTMSYSTVIFNNNGDIIGAKKHVLHTMVNS